jgi:hypothetical protein
MKLTVQRSQEPTRKGVTLSTTFQLTLLPEEQKLVTQYGLERFKVYIHSVHELLRGVRHNAIPSTAEINQWTVVGASANSALVFEQHVKDGCREFEVTLRNLSSFDGRSVVIYESQQDTGADAD